MSDFQLTGLVSGFDWRSVVDQLVALERVPQNRLRSEQDRNEEKLDAYELLQTKLEALQTASAALQDDDLYFENLGEWVSGAGSVFSGTVSPDTPTGEYAVTVDQLATATSRTGNSNVGGVIDPDGTLANQNTFPAVSSGTISINGISISIDTADSLNEVIAAINAQNAETGVTASLVDPDSPAAYDGTEYIQFTSDTASAPVHLGSATDTSNFLSVMGLYSNGTDTINGSTLEDLGKVNLFNSLEEAGLSGAITSGTGNLTINGVEIAFDTTASVNSLIESINRSEAGVTISYDPANDRFKLKNDNTGSLGLTYTDANGILSALGFDGSETLSFGDNAQVTINGSSFTSASQTLGTDVHGIDGLTVTVGANASVGSSDTYSVSADTASAREKIEKFISTYNDLQDYIDQRTRITVADEEVTTGILASQFEVPRLATDLREQVFGTVSSLTGTITRLESIGIDFRSGTNKLEIADSDALDEALANNAEEVSTLFTDSSEGLAHTMDDFIGTYLASGGAFQTQTNSLEDQNDDLDTQIERMERFILAEEERLTNSFIQMEQMQAEINRQSQALLQAFG